MKSVKSRRGDWIDPKLHAPGGWILSRSHDRQMNVGRAEWSYPRGQAEGLSPSRACPRPFSVFPARRLDKRRSHARPCEDATRGRSFLRVVPAAVGGSLPMAPASPNKTRPADGIFHSLRSPGVSGHCGDPGSVHPDSALRELLPAAQPASPRHHRPGRARVCISSPLWLARLGPGSQRAPMMHVAPFSTRLQGSKCANFSGP